MKRKQPRKPRNVFAVFARERSAGTHTKPYKAMRGKLNREGWDG